MRRLFLLSFVILFSCSSSVQKERNPFEHRYNGNIKSLTTKTYIEEDGERRLTSTVVRFYEDNLLTRYIEEEFSRNLEFSYTKTDTSYNQYMDGKLLVYTDDLGHVKWVVENGKRNGTYEWRLDDLFDDSDNYSYFSSSIYKDLRGKEYESVDTVTYHDDFISHHGNRIRSGTRIPTTVTWERDTAYYLEKDKYGNPLIVSNPPEITYYTYEYN